MARKSEKLWGGRFAADLADIALSFSESTAADGRMVAEDIWGSEAHAIMLTACEIISEEDLREILKWLEQARAAWEDGSFELRPELEDVHMNVETYLRQGAGPEFGGRLHTARSRNDQVATDFRLWVRDTIDAIDAALADLQQAMAEKAVEHAATVMPGFTHLQSAQPVTFGHHLMAYVEMLGRDRGRFQDARKRLNECPLGAAALGGTNFPIDRFRTAAALGFDRPTANSLDSVSDRDFALEAMSAASILAMHLSRFAEEIVIWTSAQFAFVKLSDKFTTGSSIMPQKRNPDAAELVRAKTGRIFGSLIGLLTVMKGLTLAYAKDMQEDKEQTFDALDAVALSIAATAGMVRDMEPDAKRLKKAAGSGYATATDLANWLVQNINMPFREAHHVTGRIVGLASGKGVDLDKLTLAEMQTVEPKITDGIYSVLSVVNSVKSRKSYGGPAPENVKKQAKRWLAALEREKRALASR